MSVFKIYTPVLQWFIYFLFFLYYNVTHTELAKRNVK